MTDLIRHRPGPPPSDTPGGTPALPPLGLDRAADRPLATQLADGLRAAAVDGVLRPGDRLPSTRALAVELGISRTVTAAAYDQLLAEGWIAGRRGSGTTVVGTPAPTASRAGHGPVESGAATRRRTAAAHPAEGVAPLISLRPGVPCVEVLDRSAWRRAWRAAADAPADRRLNPAGLPEFRAAVAEHLLRHRGLLADPTTVVATVASTVALAEIARTLSTDRPIAVEDPGYAAGAAALASAGHRLVGVPVDDEGLVVEALPPGMAAVCVTPAHQYPMGARMSARRRVALVDRARREGFLIVEDDYDGELRYDVAPLPLLAALGPDVVAHLGTASKMLSPGLGCGWLVAPPAVRQAVLDARVATATRPATAGQRVLTALATSGDLSRHLRRVRRELAGRRAAVVAALEATGYRVVGDAAGAHVVVLGPDEDDVIARAAAQGVEVDGLARHRRSSVGPSGLVIGYAGPTRAELEQALAVVVRLLRDRSGRCPEPAVAALP